MASACQIPPVSKICTIGMPRFGLSGGKPSSKRGPVRRFKPYHLAKDFCDRYQF